MDGRFIVAFLFLIHATSAALSFASVVVLVFYSLFGYTFGATIPEESNVTVHLILVAALSGIISFYAYHLFKRVKIM